MEGIIEAICISEKRGVAKHPVTKAKLEVDHGIVGDGHAGNWHRQVSLLSYDRVLEFNQKGGNVKAGDFGENLLVSNLDLHILPVGTIFTIGDVQLEMTQIGKECHSHCAIYHRVGDCIMPRLGVFAKVIKSGEIKTGDEVLVTLPDPNRPYTVAIITLSDKGFRRQREDLSGPMAVKMMQEAHYQVVETLILPDEPERLKKELIRLADGRQVDLILTTGGTGFSMRDQTPEATLEIASRNAPGISEYIRYRSMHLTNRAMLSRGVSVIRNQTLIINLPGSPKAVKESLEFILDSLDHGLAILRGSQSECAR